MQSVIVTYFTIDYIICLKGWNKVGMDVKEQVQERFQCCGFQNRAPENGTAEHPSCDLVDVSNY